MKSPAPMSRSTIRTGMGEPSPSGIMHDGWCGKLILHATSLKLASSSGYYVLDPFAFSSVGKRNQESLRGSKNIHWSPVDPNAEAGQAGCESARDSVRNSEIEGCYPAFA